MQKAANMVEGGVKEVLYYGGFQYVDFNIMEHKNHMTY